MSCKARPFNFIPTSKCVHPCHVRVMPSVQRRRADTQNTTCLAYQPRADHQQSPSHVRRGRVGSGGITYLPRANHGQMAQQLELPDEILAARCSLPRRFFLRIGYMHVCRGQHLPAVPVLGILNLQTDSPSRNCGTKVLVQKWVSFDEITYKPIFRPLRLALTAIDNLRPLESMVLLTENHLQLELYPETRSSLIPQEVPKVVLVLLALILHDSTYKFSREKNP